MQTPDSRFEQLPIDVQGTQNNDRILIFLGARPNIPKAWTLLRALNGFMPSRDNNVLLVHSGQHYSKNMGEDFARQFGIHIDINLEVGSSNSDGEQIGKLITASDIVLGKFKPSFVIVIGDVNTSVAAAVVTARRGIPVIHLEAGLRSKDWDPEEINRRVITACSRYHLAPSVLAVSNLVSEGINPENIFLVGNPMAETFIIHQSSRDNSRILYELNLVRGDYVLFTIHKPVNLSDAGWVFNLLA